MICCRESYQHYWQVNRVMDDGDDGLLFGNLLADLRDASAEPKDVTNRISVGFLLFILNK